MDKWVSNFPVLTVTVAAILSAIAVTARPSTAQVAPLFGPGVVNAPNAPVTLFSCKETHSNESPEWTIDASWLSNSKIITAIKLQVKTENAFGDVLQTDEISPTGIFSPDATSYDSWTVGDLHMPAQANVAKIQCEIVAAIFQDGTVWKAASLPVHSVLQVHPKHTAAP